jgi:hypothetical protein
MHADVVASVVALWQLLEPPYLSLGMAARALAAARCARLLRRGFGCVRRGERRTQTIAKQESVSRSTAWAALCDTASARGSNHTEGGHPTPVPPAAVAPTLYEVLGVDRDTDADGLRDA